MIEIPQEKHIKQYKYLFFLPSVLCNFFLAQYDWFFPIHIILHCHHYKHDLSCCSFVALSVRTKFDIYVFIIACKNVQTINMTCSVVHVYYPKSAICTNMTCSVVHVYYLKSAICTHMTCSVVLLWLCGDMIKVIPETSRTH